MLDRLITPRLQQSKKNILLLGPRQVGKSTLCRSLTPTRIINLADETLFLSYSKDPGLLSRELKALPKKSLLFIDEIQRVTALLNIIQAAIDEGSSHRFLLTGSSARKLKRGGANLLPGRIILEYLDPLTFWEYENQFNLDRALTMGSLPGIVLDTQEGAAILDTYASVYLREEIQAEAFIKNIGAYGRFLDLAAEASGQWINYSKLSSDSEIPKESIRRFFSILEETLIAFRLPSFQPKNSKRRVSQRDRLFFFDIGVRNALLGIHNRKLSNLEKGPLFEHWFILQCFYFSRAHRKNWKFSSYRTEGGAEVDLIIEQDEKFLAIECKYSRGVQESQLKGLRSFESLAGKKVEKYVVYLGPTRQVFSGGEVAIPFDEFLNELS